MRGVVLAVFLLGSIRTDVYSQPPLPETSLRAIEQSKQWMHTGAYNAARENLRGLLPLVEGRRQHAPVLFMLVQCDFKIHDYDEAYQRSSEFVRRFPNDGRWIEAIYIRGVSAYHIDQCDTSLASLRTFLTRQRNHPDRGAAFYWKAMCWLEHARWDSAEQDIRRCYEERSTLDYRDYALLGWAFMLERRGLYSQAIGRLEELLRNHPGSSMVNDARIRLASLFLRNNNPRRSLQELKEAKPEFAWQREEYLLLSADAHFKVHDYPQASVFYERLIAEFPESPHIRQARFGLAWSLLRQGGGKGARAQLALVEEGGDSLSLGANYNRAVLALLGGDVPEALSVLDSVVERSPYDSFAERAYFQMGMIQYRARRYSEARKHFQLAARLFPENPNRSEAFFMFGEASLALRDFANAQYGFSQAQQSGSKNDILAMSRFKEGIALYHLGRFKSGAEKLAEYLQKYPRHHHAAEGHVWKAEALYQDGRFAEAELAYTHALKAYPKNLKRMDATYGLAWALFEQKKFTPAAEAFDRYTSAYPESDNRMEASLRKADCYFFLGQYDRANTLYNTITAAKGSNRHREYAAFQIAMSFIQRGDSQRGIDHLRNFFVQFPKSIYNEVVRFNIGWTFFSNERYTQAVEEFKTLLGEFPESQLLPRVLFNMGDAFYNLRQYDSARVYYQRVIEEFPESPLATDAVAGLQFTYKAEGRPAGAIAALEELLKTKQSDALRREELLMRKADLLFDEGDYAAALEQYWQVLILKPNRNLHARVLQQIGRIYELENNPSRAALYYGQVLSEYSDTEVAPAIALSLGYLHFRNKQYADALKVLKEFPPKYPESPLLSEVQFHMGMTLLHIPDKKAAFDQFQAIIRERSGDIFAERSRIQLARLLLERKQHQVSIDTLDGVVARRNDDLAAEALLVIGENYLSMKRTSDALQAFRDIIEQYQDYPLLVERAHLGAGECYERLNDKTKARASYEAVVKSGLDASMKKEADDRLRRLGR